MSSEAQELVRMQWKRALLEYTKSIGAWCQRKVDHLSC